MEYDNFAERFLAALYFETETTGQEYHSAGAINQKYGLQPKPHWISRMADDWEHSYFRDVSKVLNGYDGWSFRISANGSSKVEADFADLDEIEEALRPGQAESTSGSAPATKVDSSSWTGLPSNFTLDEARRAELVALLTKAERDLDNLGADNSEKAMARAYIVAARALAEAPEPPADIIWEIVGRANNLAGIASLFVSIVTLFQTAMQ